MDTIEEIIAAIDIARVTTPLASFYRTRADILDRTGSRNSLFSEIFEVVGPRTGYAFHWGGRKELQFNIGFEDEGKTFRYGAAFSIERGQNLPDPVETLGPLIERFNVFLAQFPDLRNLRMWSVDKRRDESLDGILAGPISPIPSAVIREGIFIFFGESIPVGEDGVPLAAISKIVRVLNEIYPLYLAVMDASLAKEPLEYRTARLCWNDASWMRPSGRAGKSRNKGAYEDEYGFGHEEWLFDLSMQLDGYKYGFVQAINARHSQWVGKRLGLLLYTIDDRTKQRFWVATIDSVEVLTAQNSERVARTFKSRHWLEALKNDVRAIGSDPRQLLETGATELFNIRFRPEGLRVFEPPFPFPREALPTAYYNNLHEVPDIYADLFRPNSPLPTGAVSVVPTGGRTYTIVATQAYREVPYSNGVVDLIQAQWQKKLQHSLAAELQGVSVHIEYPVGRQSVDVALLEGALSVFIELKPRGTVRQVIRAALSQLMEYAYWPADDRCRALLIVGPVAAGPEDLEYLATLRERFDIPVHYLPYREGTIEGIADWYRALGGETKKSTAAFNAGRARNA